MSISLDLSDFFKKAKNAALKQLEKGRERVDIAYDENAELVDKYHKSHELQFGSLANMNQLLHVGEKWIQLYLCSH